MFFDDEDNPEAIHMNPALRRELYSITCSLNVTPYGLRSVPTHTEDGIPIRKLYVSNLPPKTTRSEIFAIFAQYGFIKSCWLHMGEKGPNNSPTPTYAFVTFSNPEDAHKALQAPNHEKTFRGRILRISPADSWHQPAEDADGRVHWKPRGERRLGDASAAPIDQPDTEELAGNPDTSSDLSEAISSGAIIASTDQDEDKDSDSSYSLLNVLNRDCLTHILSFVPVRDLIRSERVSKEWQNMVQEYLESMRMFKTSWWQHVPVTLTTAVLRRVLQRAGGALQKLHIDHHWSALNDRTAHTVGKFCPHLEELKVVGMHTKNWNPLIYGCKQLKSLSFVSCNKLTDSSLVHLVKRESCIESLTVANNTHVTGLFLTGSHPPKLNSLAFYNCYSLQGTVLSAAIDTLPNLTSLKLDVCPVTMWKIVPLIINKLPKLEELSLSEYTLVEKDIAPQGSDAFCKSLSTLTELKTLNLSRNIYVTNAVLKQVAHTCRKLQSLNISSCNSKKSFPHQGVGDEGIAAVCGQCAELTTLDVSYLVALTDAGLAAAARCARLAALVARGNPGLSAEPLAACLAACPDLQEVDLCGCDMVSEAVVEAAARALAARARPRALTLRLYGTAAALHEHDYPTHKLLVVNTYEDRSNLHLRPDFEDRIFVDDSMEDLYDHDHDHLDFLGSDEELFMDDDLDDYEGAFAFGLPPDIILL